LRPSIELHSLVHHWLLRLHLHHRLLHGYHRSHVGMRGLHVRMGGLVDRGMSDLLLLLLPWDDDD
jgi:hypothetical protein